MGLNDDGLWFTWKRYKARQRKIIQFGMAKKEKITTNEIAKMVSFLFCWLLNLSLWFVPENVSVALSAFDAVMRLESLGRPREKIFEFEIVASF